MSWKISQQAWAMKPATTSAAAGSSHAWPSRTPISAPITVSDVARSLVVWWASAIRISL